MKLYHGSNCDFQEVDLSKSKDKRDFGKGFYTTTFREQAHEWAETLFDRYGGFGFYVYEFDFEPTTDLKIKRFDALAEEWLQMIRENRVMGGVQHSFDVVEGAVANDKTNRTIALFVEGIYTVEMAIEKLRHNKSNNQVSFHTEKALKNLHLIKKEYYGE